MKNKYFDELKDKGWPDDNLGEWLRNDIQSPKVLTWLTQVLRIEAKTRVLIALRLAQDKFGRRANLDSAGPKNFDAAIAALEKFGIEFPMEREAISEEILRMAIVAAQHFDKDLVLEL